MASTAASTPQLPTPLNDLQLELLKLYSTKMTAQELGELKQWLARYFANKAIASADRLWDERALSDDDMDSWLHG